MTRVTLGKSRVRESRTPGSVRAKAEWLSYSTVTICGLNRRDALGIARLAIDTLTGTVAGKPTRRRTLGERIQARKALRDDV
jgi:hypothetical protein